MVTSFFLSFFLSFLFWLVCYKYTFHDTVSSYPEPIYREISQCENGLTPAGLAATSSSTFFGEIATVFLVRVLQAPFLGTPSAMAKSADDIARQLNASDPDNSALADAIVDYFEDCSLCDAEGVGSISEGFLETAA